MSHYTNMMHSLQQIEDEGNDNGSQSAMLTNMFASGEESYGPVNPQKVAELNQKVQRNGTFTNLMLSLETNDPNLQQQQQVSQTPPMPAVSTDQQYTVQFDTVPSIPGMYHGEALGSYLSPDDYNDLDSLCASGFDFAALLDCGIGELGLEGFSLDGSDGSEFSHQNNGQTKRRNNFHSYEVDSETAGVTLTNLMMSLDSRALNNGAGDVGTLSMGGGVDFEDAMGRHSALRSSRNSDMRRSHGPPNYNQQQQNQRNLLSSAQEATFTNLLGSLDNNLQRQQTSQLHLNRNSTQSLTNNQQQQAAIPDGFDEMLDYLMTNTEHVPLATHSVLGPVRRNVVSAPKGKAYVMDGMIDVSLNFIDGEEFQVPNPHQQQQQHATPNQQQLPSHLATTPSNDAAKPVESTGSVSASRAASLAQNSRINTGIKQQQPGGGGGSSNNPPNYNPRSSTLAPPNPDAGPRLSKGSVPQDSRSRVTTGVGPGHSPYTSHGRQEVQSQGSQLAQQLALLQQQQQQHSQSPPTQAQPTPLTQPPTQQSLPQSNQPKPQSFPRPQSAQSLKQTMTLQQSANAQQSQPQSPSLQRNQTQPAPQTQVQQPLRISRSMTQPNQGGQQQVQASSPSTGAKKTDPDEEVDEMLQFIYQKRSSEPRLQPPNAQSGGDTHVPNHRLSQPPQDGGDKRASDVRNQQAAVPRNLIQLKQAKPALPANSKQLDATDLSSASGEVLLGFRNLELVVTASIREIFSNLSILRRNDPEIAKQHGAIIAKLFLSNRNLLSLLNSVDRNLYAPVPRHLSLVDALVHDTKHFITLSVHIMKLLKAAVAREHVDVLYKDIALRVQAILTSMRLFPKGDVVK